METILFTNWTDEDFIGYWDSISYPIKKGQSIYLEDWKAKHFAKHLVDRELNKEGKPTSDPMRVGLEAKCFGESEEVKSEVEIENLNKSSEISSEISPKDEVATLKAKVAELEAKENTPQKIDKDDGKGKLAEPAKVDKRTKEYKSQEKFEGLNK